jgi:hypothetical protein
MVQRLRLIFDEAPRSFMFCEICCITTRYADQRSASLACVGYGSLCLQKTCHTMSLGLNTCKLQRLGQVWLTFLSGRYRARTVGP